MNCLVREATEGDFEVTSLLFAEGDSYHCQALPDILREPASPGRSRRFLLDLLSGEDTTVLVAERHGEIIGLLQMSVRSSPAIPLFVPRRYAVIESLLVREACRRTGVGRSLVREAERWSKAHGATQVELNVWEFNAGALAFYEKLGYTTARRILSTRLAAD